MQQDISEIPGARIFRAGADRMADPWTALSTARSICALKTLLGPLRVAALQRTTAIARVDHDRIVAPDCDLAALGAAEALEERLEEAFRALSSAAEVFMAGRDESEDELLARLDATYQASLGQG